MPVFWRNVKGIEVDFAVENAGDGTGQRHRAKRLAVERTVNDELETLHGTDLDGELKPVLGDSDERRGDGPRAARPGFRLHAPLIGSDRDVMRRTIRDEIDIGTRRREFVRMADSPTLTLHVNPRQVIDRHDAVRHAAVDEIIAAMATDVKEDELNPVKEFMVKEAIASLDENTDWCASIAATQLNGVDVFNGQAEMLNTITLDEVKAFWKEFLAQGNRQTIILNPVQ